jgi:hypothetical protein
MLIFFVEDLPITGTITSSFVLFGYDTMGSVYFVAKPQVTTCKSPNWSCSNDSSQCIPPSQLCDGRRHCADGSDENCLRKC